MLPDNVSEVEEEKIVWRYFLVISLKGFSDALD